MIRKCLKSLCIFGLTLLPISFSSADWNSVSCYEYEGLSTNVVYGNTILTFNNGNFSTNRGGESMENVIWLTRNGYNSANNQQGYWVSSAFGYIDGKPYLYAGSYSETKQGFPTNVCVESLDNFNLNSYGSNLNCNSQEIGSFLSNKNILGGGYCYPDSNNNYAYALFTYCFYDSNNAYCFKTTSYNAHQALTYSGSVGLSTPLTVSKLNNISRSPSPFNSSTFEPIQEYTDITDSEIIDYFENNPGLNFNENMCYIGTFDLNSNYEDKITFYQGSGYSIYEFFSQLYGNSFKLSDLDIWLNSWLVNYNTFFNGLNRYSDGTPWYVLRYNGIGNLLVDKNNLDNPFLNNKSAYFFMASNILDSFQGYYNNNQISEELAVYCYKKTNPSGNIVYDPSNAIKNNVGTWVYNGRTVLHYSGWTIQQGESWNGTPLDYFTGDSSYTGLDSFFKSNFNKFAGLFQGLDPSDLVLGQLPSYIVGFLLLLLLFRFLSH